MRRGVVRPTALAREITVVRACRSRTVPTALACAREILLLTSGDCAGDGWAVEVSEAIERAALFPYTDLRPLPEGHPTRRVTMAGIEVQLPGDSSRASAWAPERLEESRVDGIVGEVRRFLRREGREQAVWMVPEAALPHDLAERLRTLGMVPHEQPPSGSRAAAMVAAQAPPPGPSQVEARQAATFGEFLAGRLATVDAFGMDGQQRRAFQVAAEHQWQVENRQEAAALFVALIDGEVVGSARALFGRTAVYLTGGGTHPSYRGRGVYRALVRARWDAAAERGTPVLTTSAGAMSWPILERLGFLTIGWIDCLHDDLASVRD